MICLHTTSGRRRRTAGFTLIELLVVIAIIAILAAILFPVIGSAKDRAKQAQCSSNMRQIGQAFQMYLNQYNDMWPSLHYGAHLFLLEPYIRQTRMAVGADVNSKKPALTVWLCPSAPLDMYYMVNRAYWDDIGTVPPWFRYGATTDSVKVFHSYVVNRSIREYTDTSGVFHLLRAASLRHISHTVLMAETCYWPTRIQGLGSASTALDPREEQKEVTGFSGKTEGRWCRCATPPDGSNVSQSHIHPRHSGGANFLWADMHVSLENKVPDLSYWLP